MQFSLGIFSNWISQVNPVSIKFKLFFIYSSLLKYLLKIGIGIMLECHVFEIQCFNFVKDNNGNILIFPLIIYFASHKM